MSAATQDLRPHPLLTAAEHRLALAEGLLGSLGDRDPVVRGRAQASAARFLGDGKGELRARLVEVAKAERATVKKNQGMIECPSCGATRLATASCPVCDSPPVADPPTPIVDAPPAVASEEQIMARDQVNSLGQVEPMMVEAAGAGLGARGARGARTPAAAAAAQGGQSTFSPDLHPRSQGGPEGGRFIAKGEGMGSKTQKPQPSGRVKQLQERLRELGFQVDQDGQFGMHTEEAVKAFQAKYGLPETGQVDERTVEAMRNPPKLTAQQAQQSIAGHSGTAIRQAQKVEQMVEQTLNDLGYDYGGTDTAKSLEQLQRLYGLQVTGKPDEPTQKLLMRLGRRSGKDAKAEAKRTGNLAADEGSGAQTQTRLQTAAIEGHEEDGMGVELKDGVQEASFSRGSEHPYGGIGGLSPVVTGRVVGGQPEARGTTTLADPADRTPGMDDFFGNEPITAPPNLREAPEGFQSCTTCVHYDGKRLCALFSAGVGPDDLCDSWYSLTPVAQQNAAEAFAAATAVLTESSGSDAAIQVARVRRLRELLEEAVTKTGAAEVAAVARGLLGTMNPLAARTEGLRIVVERRIREARNDLPGYGLEEAKGAKKTRCPDCGKMMAADTATCPECGHKMLAEAEARELAEARKERLMPATRILSRVGGMGMPEAAAILAVPGVTFDLVALDEAADSMAKATIHSPIGKPGGPGLWKHKGLQLPAYIQHIAKAMMRDGKEESSAIATAVAAVERWAAGGGGVDATTRAAAAKAVAEWEALKGKAKAGRAGKKLTEAADHDLAALLDRVALAEAHYPASIHFDPRLHPRDRRGEFAGVLGRLMKAKGGSEVTLPHGIVVKRRMGGSLTVHQGSKKIGTFSNPAAAAERALGATGIPDRYEQPSHSVTHERYLLHDPGETPGEWSPVDQRASGIRAHQRTLASGRSEMLIQRPGETHWRHMAMTKRGNLDQVTALSDEQAKGLLGGETGGYVHLQYIGRHPAVKASAVKVGQHRVYNSGVTGEITKVEDKAGWTHITTREKDGSVHTKKHRPDTLVPVSDHSAYSDPGARNPNFDPQRLGPAAASRHELEHQRGYADAAAGEPRALGTAHWYGKGYSKFLDEQMHAGEARARLNDPARWEGIGMHPETERMMADLRRTGEFADPGTATLERPTARRSTKTQTFDTSGTGFTVQKITERSWLAKVGDYHVKGIDGLGGPIEHHMPAAKVQPYLDEQRAIGAQIAASPTLKALTDEFGKGRGFRRATTGNHWVSRVGEHDEAASLKAPFRAEASNARYGYQTPKPFEGTLPEIAKQIDANEADRANREMFAQRSGADSNLLTRHRGAFAGRPTLTSALREVPSDWAVKHGYATTNDEGKSFSWGAAATPERIVYHYLGGARAPENKHTEGVAAEQWAYKPKGKKADRMDVIRRLTEASLPALGGYLSLFVPASSDSRILCEAKTVSGARLPLASLLVEHADRIPPELRDELRRRLAESCSVEDATARLTEARAAREPAKVRVYETILGALG